MKRDVEKRDPLALFRIAVIEQELHHELYYLTDLSGQLCLSQIHVDNVFNFCEARTYNVCAGFRKPYRYLLANSSRPSRDERSLPAKRE